MLYIYVLNDFHYLAQIFTHLSTLSFLPTLAIYTMLYSIKTSLILFEFVYILKAFFFSYWNTKLFQYLYSSTSYAVYLF